MTTLKIPVGNEDHVLGQNNAAVTLVEYGDYQCPFCRAAHKNLQHILKLYGSHLRFVFRHFPLTKVHHHAEMAAEAAEYAGLHHRFWEMHDLLFENQPSLSLPLLLSLGQTLNLPVKALEESITKKVYQNRIHEDFMGGVRSGVSGTPAFFINDERYKGTPQELESFLKSQIETRG